MTHGEQPIKRSSRDEPGSALAAPPGKGRPRPGTKLSHSLAQLWARAESLNAAAEPGRGEWVPIDAIWVRAELLPRTMVDQDAVARYAACFDDLPPIEVQRDTFVLLDGLTRLTAAGRAHRAHIRIRELDLPDSALADYAAAANLRHGLPLTRDERIASGRRMYERHHPLTGGSSGEAWTPRRIAESSGVDERTVQRWMERERAGMPPATDAAPVVRVSASGRTYLAAPQPVQPSRSVTWLTRMVEEAERGKAALVTQFHPEERAELRGLALRMAAVWREIAQSAGEQEPSRVSEPAGVARRPLS